MREYIIENQRRLTCAYAKAIEAAEPDFGSIFIKTGVLLIPREGFRHSKNGQFRLAYSLYESSCTKGSHAEADWVLSKREYKPDLNKMMDTSKSLICSFFASRNS